MLSKMTLQNTCTKGITVISFAFITVSKNSHQNKIMRERRVRQEN